MKVILWILQVVMAVLFLSAGWMKAFSPMEALSAQMPWTLDVSPWVVRLPGYSELLGAVGLILPALTRIKPQLTPLAAAGLALVMALAVVFHVVRAEYGVLPVNLVILALCAFIAYGRFKLAPIAPKK